MNGIEVKTPGKRWSRKYETHGSMSHPMAADITVWWEILGWKEDRKPLPKFLNDE